MNRAKTSVRRAARQFARECERNPWLPVGIAGAVVVLINLPF